MKHFLLFVLFFLNSFISSFLVAQVSPEVSWIKELEGLKDEDVYKRQVLNSGNLNGSIVEMNDLT